MIPTGRYLYFQLLHTYFESCPARPSFSFLVVVIIIRSTIYLGRASDTVFLNGCALLTWCTMITYLGKVLVVVYEETTCKRHPTTVLMHPMPRMISAGRVR